MSMLTVRMSPELYAGFKELAYQYRGSMNEVAVSILAGAVGRCPAAKAVRDQFASAGKKDGEQAWVCQLGNGRCGMGGKEVKMRIVRQVPDRRTLPQRGDFRIKRVFLWWPLTIKTDDGYGLTVRRETRWLEWARVESVFTYAYGGSSCWLPVRFMD